MHLKLSARGSCTAGKRADSILSRPQYLVCRINVCPWSKCASTLLPLISCSMRRERTITIRLHKLSSWGPFNYGRKHRKKPKDKFNALLGISRDAMVPVLQLDYKNSLREVYAEIVRFALQTDSFYSFCVSGLSQAIANETIQRPN
jgi:hypothetical protein